ncbi:MAG: lipoate--protein ligase family protein [Pseudanabaenaceae cyanobacterium bins.39]|nr:lipoate--protein ligase family protein [Pseudanabaenaceae cyanobacterium bins.39]
MTRPWQILDYGAGLGQQQMDYDRQLLDRHSQNLDFPCTLRFYSWQPAAISLGFHQKQYPDHWNAIAKQYQLEIVRRPSGGRAVLHYGDLTYAVITEVNGRSHRQVYEAICEFLIKGFARLGVELSYGKAGRGYIHNPSCFSTATNADLVIGDGRKLIGSAQVYRHNSVLQHGSIAIAPNYDLLRALFTDDIPIVGYQEIAPVLNLDQSFDQKFDQSVSQIIEQLTQSARQYLLTELL